MMTNINTAKDNILLVDFEMIIDMDIAVLRYFISKFANSKYIDEEMVDVDNDGLRYCLLNRPRRNPLDVIFKDDIDADTTKIYQEVLRDHYNEIMYKYADVTDVLDLLYSFIGNASSLEVYIRCDNQEQCDLITKINKNLDVIVSPRNEIDLSNYTVIYEKFLEDIQEYQMLEGKHIYTAKAEFNSAFMLGPHYEEYASCNLIHFMDLYVDVKVDMYNEDDFNYDKYDEEDDEEE